VGSAPARKLGVNPRHLTRPLLLAESESPNRGHHTFVHPVVRADDNRLAFDSRGKPDQIWCDEIDFLLVPGLTAVASFALGLLTRRCQWDVALRSWQGLISAA
jgi:hypothetical protein